MFTNALIDVQTFMAGSGWAGFKNGLDDFFRKGLGGDGAQGLGIAIMVLGIVCACVSFALHHFNPQSRFPSWVMCLMVGVAGGILMNGVEQPIRIFKSAADWVLSLIGL